MPTKRQRVLRQRAVSWNILSGNVSSPTVMRVPLVTNTVRMPLVTGGVPFSMSRGGMHGLKHVGKKRANPEIPENAPEKGKIHTCPWCDSGSIARELKSVRRSLWRCLGCNRRWWASADNPQEMTRHRPKLSRQVCQSSFWRQIGGLGW